MKTTAADELQGAAVQMESWPADRILAWGAARFRRPTLATGFGVEGCVLIDLAARHELPFEFFTLDTGLLFAETYALWQRLECRYGIRIRGVRPAQTVAEQAAAHGPDLWARNPDRCCELRKVVPLREALANHDLWATAIRRDQTAARATARHVEWDAVNGLVKLNPLLRWSAKDVWQYVRKHDVPFNRLHEQGYESIGCRPCTTPIAAGEDPRAGRWRGRQKTECGLHFVLQPTGTE